MFEAGGGVRLRRAEVRGVRGQELRLITQLREK